MCCPLISEARAEGAQPCFDRFSTSLGDAAPEWAMSLFGCIGQALGYPYRRPSSNMLNGRLDMAVRFNGQIYLFEFKVVELTPKGRALQQIKDRGYADKYRAEDLPINLIGVEFSRKQRSVVGFEVESVRIIWGD